MTFPFDGNCIHPRTKQNKNGVFCLACHQMIVEPKQSICLEDEVRKYKSLYEQRTAQWKALDETCWKLHEELESLKLAIKVGLIGPQN